MFGQTNEDDVLAILNVYCAAQAEKRTGTVSYEVIDLCFRLDNFEIYPNYW